LRRRCQMKIREEDLAVAEPRDLGRERLLHFQHQVGALPHLVDRGEPCADGGVLVIADAASRAGSVLDDNAMARLGEGAGPRRRQRDALLARLDLAWNPDVHRVSRTFTSRITGKTRRGAPRTLAAARRGGRGPFLSPPPSGPRRWPGRRRRPARRGAA